MPRPLRPGSALPLAALALILASAWPVAAQTRHELSLNGTWQVQKVRDLTLPPPPAWQPMAIPGYLSGYDYERAWLRREFSVPATMQGQRIEVAFGGVKFNSTVYVNGHRVGGHFGGYEAFAADVTEHVRFDGPNELLVGLHDWTGVFVDQETRFDGTAGMDARYAPHDKVLAPIGGMIHLYGIWDDVTLRAHPAVHLSDCFIQPSVRRRELVVHVTVSNATGSPVPVLVAGSVRGEAGSPEVLSLGPQGVTVPAQGEASLVLRAPWAAPRLWSHEDPFLYHLTLTLRGEAVGGPVLDETETRFGFREFWTQGPDFYLNGHKVHLLATSWWPPGMAVDRDYIRRQLLGVRASGAFAFRTHTQPWTEAWYEVADEVGVLMIPEGAVWNDDEAYRVNDPRFWANYADHLRAMVARLKNHPSVVMWSLENELFGSRVNDATPSRKDLARMGTLMKQWDPTRPIFYESDGDPEGVADVIGVHYPHEYPEFTQWPNEADWLRAPIRIGHQFTGGTGRFFWERKKPLYIGEFLWIPSSDPSWHTVFFGDRAYEDYEAYRNRAKAEAWRMQILGYRRHEVSGISPWTVVEGGPLDESNPLFAAQRWAYRPVAAFVREYDRRFYAGERVTRTVDLYNDTLRAAALEFRWWLQGAAGKAGAERLRLDPGQHVVRRLVVPMPPVKARTRLRLCLRLSENGASVFEEKWPVEVWPLPRLRAPSGVHIGLYDPEGRTTRALRRLGLASQPVRALARIPRGLHVLILGADALAAQRDPAPVIGRVDPARQALDCFLEAGGRILVLEQRRYPAGLFPASPGPRRSTMTFPLAPSHPVLRGIAPDDLKWWRGDHFVTAGEPARPDRGGGRAVVVSGSQEGLARAPLLEFVRGRGLLILSQLLLVSKLEREPVAARLLQNCLDYLARWQPDPGRTGVIAASPAFREHLDSLGLRFDDLTGRLAKTDLTRYRLLVAQGSAATLLAARRPLERFLDRGGVLLLHRPSPADFARLRPLHRSALVPQPCTGPVTPLRSPRLPALALPREDLYWLGKHVGEAQTTTPLASNVAEFALLPRPDLARSRTYDPRAMRVDAAIGGVDAEGAYLATGGTIAVQIDVPAPGRALIGLEARGTPVSGEYPNAALSLTPARGGGKSVSLGVVTAGSREWAVTGVLAQVAPGPYRLSVSFINDAQAGGEDRNLYLRRVLVAPVPSTMADFLTTPPALVRLPRGKGSIVVDALRWDSERANAVKADRLACALLAALGGDLQTRGGTNLEAEDMRPDPKMPYFQNLGSSVALNARGYVETDIHVARTARYRLEVVARGTPAKGGLPEVDVLLDGRRLGRVALTVEGWRAYPIIARLPAGRHRLRLEYINDLQAPPEDRNLALDRVVVLEAR